VHQPAYPQTIHIPEKKTMVKVCPEISGKCAFPTYAFFHFTEAVSTRFSTLGFLFSKNNTPWVPDSRAKLRPF
jgi:hypothetical protein